MQLNKSQAALWPFFHKDDIDSPEEVTVLFKRRYLRYSFAGMFFIQSCHFLW
tara:strand:- start:3569 stop:3724 length:156 start_codon:yes stop_codon:yes gene_type:complete